MKTILFLMLFAISLTHSKRMLGSVSLGVGTGIDAVGKSLDSKVIVNADLLYRVSNWGLVGLEADLNTWSMSKPSYNTMNLNDTSAVTVGRAGFLASLRAETGKEATRFFGQIGVGPFSSNINISGGGVNGRPEDPPIKWALGYNLQAGIAYRWAELKVSSKQIFLEDADQNWFGISAGFCWEFLK